MRSIFKKSLIALILLVSAVTAVACKGGNPVVTFDPQNGGAVTTVEVVKGEAVALPEDPVKSGTNFKGWYTSSDGASGTFHNFADAIDGDLTLYGVWTTNVLVKYNTKTSITIEPTELSNNGGTVSNAPSVSPAKDGFDFKGWFSTKVGKTWNEENAQKFPLTVNKATTLYAYYEPKDSKTVNWSNGETYMNSFTEVNTEPVLNPLVYQWAHENQLIDFLSTPLYGFDVNWDQAIEDGLAKYAGDFDLVDAENIGSLLRENVLVGAAAFPKALDGQSAGSDGTTEDGKFSTALSTDIYATKYEVKLREDVYWQDGTPVTANDYYYSYFQYIDGVQNNFRADSYYPSADRTAGMRVLNARGYFLQGTNVGLGEDPDTLNLKPDYQKYVAVGYIGAGFSGGAYEGTALTALGIPTRFYFSQETFDSLELEIGNGQVMPAGVFPYNPSNITTFDIRANIMLNPWFVGDKGTQWPAVTKDQVGFKVIDDYTLEITYEAATAHSSIITNMTNLRLVHPASYAKSLDSSGANSTYGTVLNNPVSYGAYLIKSWDAGQKLILNKNYTSIMHTRFNYKSISFEYYETVDARMTAFDQGLLDIAGLNQTHYVEYLEHPNKKDTQLGYPTYLQFNTRPYEGQNAEVVKIIKEQSFRQAFFFGFNRIEFATTIFAPNMPSFMVTSLNATQYDNDPEWYTQTPEYKEMLESLGIDLNNYGYDPVKAKAYFDAAYQVWLDNGNTGPIPINYLTEEGAESERIDKYILDSFTNLFGADKIKFTRNAFDDGVRSDKLDDYEFDLNLGGVGTGQPTNTSVQLPITGLFGRSVDGGWGWNEYSDLGVPASVLIIDEANKLDLRATYNFLKEHRDNPDTEIVEGWNEDTDDGTLKPLYDILDRYDGYFVGDLTVIHEFGLACLYIWAGLAPQYDGDVEDRNTVTRAFDRIILEYATIIGIGSRAQSVVYSDAVVCRWPAYHNILNWGQQRYWYLNTDPDFQ